MNHPMKYFYDTEFLEDGKTIELISIGIVSEDGRNYYAVNAEVNADDDEHSLGRRIARHEWLMQNVVPSLPLRTPVSTYSSGTRRYMPPHLDMRDTRVKPKWVIANEVREFLLDTSEPIELWADYGAYDHVLLMQLWGPMIARPKPLPMWTHDIQHEIERLGLTKDDLPKPDPEEYASHHALDDAIWGRVLFDFIRSSERISS